MKNPETILKTMETNQKVLIFRYKQTDRQTLHHNIYITTIIVMPDIITVTIRAPRVFTTGTSRALPSQADHVAQLCD